MISGGGRWVRYGKIGAAAAVVTAVVVGAANLDGFLSMVERITGSSGAAETVEPRQPQHTTTTVTNPPITMASQPGSPTTTKPAVPPPTATARPQVATAVPTIAPRNRAGALVITIRMGSGGKVGPSEYRAGATPGANVDVYDDVGQLSAGCYPSWVLTREGTEVQKVRNGRCTSGGITMFNFNDSLDTPGNYRLSVNVVTDSGQTGSSFVDFTVH